MVWFSDFDYGVVGYVLRCRHDDIEGSMPYQTILDLTEGRLTNPGDVRFRYRMFTDRKVPDVFRVENRLAVVSARFRDLLGQFELGSTQFFDAEITTSKGQPVPGPFFVLNVCEWKDTLVPERSRVQPINAARRGPIFTVVTLEPRTPVTVEAGDGLDLWREKRLLHGIFFSDRLAQVCRAAKFRPLRLFPAEIVAGV
jgi:hypothetical protein